MDVFEIVDHDGLRLMAIPPGNFSMGAASDELDPFKVPERYYGREAPRRTISIDEPFAVSVSTVTRAQFARFVENTGHTPAHWCEVWRNGEAVFDDTLNWQDPGFPQAPDHPVVAISWLDAKAYLAWLSEKNGKTYRLLSDAEFEYAMRAGSSSTWFWGDDESLMPDYVVNNQISQAFPYTAPVGSLKPNAFGLYDMLGNVWEWVEDAFEEKRVTNTQGAAAIPGTELKVIRGSGWKSPRFDIRCSARQRDYDWHNDQDIGFRVARELDANEKARLRMVVT